MNIIFCAYRDWGKSLFNRIEKIGNTENFHLVDSKEKLEEKIQEVGGNVKFILFVGWSWIVPDHIIDKYLCLGIHPSDLPSYRGGSPLQNQIIDGVTSSKVTLMELTKGKIDAGRIWGKEDLDLTGNSMNDILSNLEESSYLLLENLIDNIDFIDPIEQDLSSGSYFSRRKPEQGRITPADFSSKSLKEIYNLIRCLTDPYPNAYMEDENGDKIFFTGIRYEKINDGK